ncbi:hypothetical protein F0231_02985 [Vibrio sp. RE86]|uniref:YadA C-terminal domain-containing protein n=1 Tax=Vibrio sp. RE86 TaxID=2607605 RepID=UPI00149364C0|nr:YadA C-terminal domain-containing protein [Vibrio sp. RE86]NOH78700.1 hypothetical protein [Vibrio sp. RE86]
MNNLTKATLSLIAISVSSASLASDTDYSILFQHLNRETTMNFRNIAHNAQVMSHAEDEIESLQVGSEHTRMMVSQLHDENAQINTEQNKQIAGNHQNIERNVEAMAHVKDDIESLQIGADYTRMMVTIVHDENAYINTEQDKQIAGNHQNIEHNAEAMAHAEDDIESLQVGSDHTKMMVSQLHDENAQINTEQNKQIAGNHQSIESLQGENQMIKQAVSDTHQQNVRTNLQQDAQIHSNALANSRQDQQILQNHNEIQGLKQDMIQMAKEVDGAYAESAAFAGLVEPYGVGKLSITAALGYHGDAQAVAFGVSERFSGQLTAKLGGAYDTATKTESAFVGVGYEF